MENLLDDLDQLLNARIADAVLAGRRQRKQPLKAENVPRIDKGTAGDAALQQILDFRQTPGRLAQASLVGLDLPARQPAEDLAEQTHGHGRDAPRLGAAGVGIAHLGEQQGQVALLQLRGAMAGEVGVEVLPGGAERLPRRRLLLAQPGRVLALQSLEQMFIEHIAIAGDARQQRGERGGGIVRGRAVAADAGRHEQRAGQHGGGLHQQLVASTGERRTGRRRCAPAGRRG